MRIPTILAIAAIISSAHGAIYSINPTSTYLRTTDGSSPFVLELSSIGISAGDTITIVRLGRYSGGTGFADDDSLVTGVFSSSAIVLPNGELNRISGAINAGPDFISGSLIGGASTDIVEDFIIDNQGDRFSVELLVPVGANYLFIGLPDTINGDNSDPNADFGVSVQKNSVSQGLPVQASIYSAVEIAWTSTAGKIYQIQSTLSLESGSWVDIGSPVIGDNSERSFFDKTREQTKRFYRVIEVQ